VAECCLLNFFWLCDEDDAKLLNGRNMCLVGKGDKYLMTTKVKHFGFLDSNSFQFHFVVWKLSRGMLKACDFNYATNVCFRISIVLKLVSKALGVHVSVEFLGQK
jgi:hypothetical protein